MAPMFLLSCFLEHPLRLEKHHLSFRDTMFCIEVVAIGLLECCGTPRILQISPATAINDTDFLKDIAIKTLMFCRILAKFEDLCLVHVVE